VRPVGVGAALVQAELGVGISRSAERASSTTSIDLAVRVVHARDVGDGLPIGADAVAQPAAAAADRPGAYDDRAADDERLAALDRLDQHVGADRRCISGK
jgi:hypothetical protein